MLSCSARKINAFNTVEELTLLLSTIPVFVFFQILKGKGENLMGILDIGAFETNSKAINNAYETYVLGVGDFDERIFLGEDANAEIGTPAKSSTSDQGTLVERITVKKDLRQSFEVGV